MTAKPKLPPTPVRSRQWALKAAAPPKYQPDARWQRTVRYVWDKGGARGGRR